MVVHIANLITGGVKDVEEVRAERIKKTFGHLGYEHVVVIDRPIPFYKIITFYTIVECYVVTIMRDGMNLTPYKYIVCKK